MVCRESISRAPGSRYPSLPVRGLHNGCIAPNSSCNTSQVAKHSGDHQLYLVTQQTIYLFWSVTSVCATLVLLCASERVSANLTSAAIQDHRSDFSIWRLRCLAAPLMGPLLSILNEDLQLSPFHPRSDHCLRPVNTMRSYQCIPSRRMGYHHIMDQPYRLIN